MYSISIVLTFIFIVKYTKFNNRKTAFSLPFQNKFYMKWIYSTNSFKSLLD